MREANENGDVKGASRMNEYPLTSMVTLALVVLAIFLSSRVGGARTTFTEKHQNPDMWHSLEIYSDADFMIAFRNHQNLLENLVLVLPTLWICAIGVSDLLAFVFGFLYFTGRVWWARNYPRSFSHRSANSLCLFSLIVLLVGAAGSTIHTLATQL